MDSPRDVTIETGLEGIEIRFTHDRAAWVVPGALSFVVVWLMVVLAAAPLAGGVWFDWSLVEILISLFVWGMLSAFTLPAMEYAGSRLAERTLVRQLELGAHRLHVGTERSPLPWTVHDIVEIRAGHAGIFCAVVIRLRDGTEHRLSTARMTTARWLAGVIQQWWRERGTEPTDESRQLQRAVQQRAAQ